MTKAISNICNQIQVGTLWTTEEAINSLNDTMDDINIFPLVKTTDIVGLCNGSVMEDGVDGTNMIYYIQPVAYVFVLAIDRKWFTMKDVINKKRDQPLWKLIRTIIVRTVCHNGRHFIGIVESRNKVI